MSAAGDWLTLLAASVLVYRLTGSTAAPAGLILVRVVPRLLGPFLGGTIGDLLSLTRGLAACLAGQAVLTILVVPAARGRHVAAIYVCLGLAQVLGGAVRPMLGALVARVATPAGLGRASSAFSLITSMAMLVGPAVGVSILQAAGADGLFILDTASFVVAAAVILTLHPRPAAGRSARRSAFRSAAAGLRPVLGDPVLRILVSSYFCSAVLIATVQSAIVLIAADRFGADDRSGYLYAAVGVGGVAGAVLTLCFHPRHLGRTVVVGSSLCEIVPLVLVVLSYHLWLAVLLLALSSAGAIGYQAWGSAELARRLPPELLARGNAVVYFALFGGQIAGTLGALLLIPLAGWPADVVCAAVVSLGLIAAALLSTLHMPDPLMVRRRRRSRYSALG